MNRVIHWWNRLYADYKQRYDYFGRGENDVVKRLRALRREVWSARRRGVM